MEQINVKKGLKRKYIIPCFQREYSWKEEEIEQLIQNLKDVKEKYCLGIITIQDKKNEMLLIDGQQRITTLYLIAIYCNLINNKDEINLSFEYEELIEHENSLKKMLSGEEGVSPTIVNGYRIVGNNINESEKEKINKILDKVYYYEINVNDDVDLNHYFEVMNSRGVQLSRSDMIKAFLMNKLKDNVDNQNRLNYLWYKYENMDNDKNFFKTFNGPNGVSKKFKSDERSINEIIEKGICKEIIESNKFNKNSENDNSILNFEYFLLYVIRLYKDIDNDNYDVVGEFNLNDLNKEYEEVFYDKTSSEIVDFLNFMIAMKNNYDKYIVKYDKDNGNWKNLIQNDKTLLIQSCLRVSFVNRRLMHWIYITLKYFYKNHDINKYNDLMRDIIRKKYVKDFLEKANKVNYKTSFETPNIILNYLDLLIKENYSYVVSKISEAKGLKVEEFKYQFRNSIEHFKARHDVDIKETDKWVEDFGNLALLDYETNINMQNATPDEKAKHFCKDLSRFSLKLQIMSKIAIKRKWDDNQTIKVRNVMIELLENDYKKVK